VAITCCQQPLTYKHSNSNVFSVSGSYTNPFTSSNINTTVATSGIQKQISLININTIANYTTYLYVKN